MRVTPRDVVAARDAREVYRARPSDLARARGGESVDAGGGRTHPALAFLGDGDDEDDGARDRARGTTMMLASSGRARALVLTPGTVTRGGATADAAATAALSARLVRTLFPGFVVDETRTMMGRGVVVVDPETWVVLLGVEPWQFGVYAVRARDVGEAGRKVLTADGKPCFSLRDTSPLFELASKRRVDELRRELEEASRRVATRGDDAVEARASASLRDVDEVMATMGLVESEEKQPPSARVLKERLRRKERKIRKRAEHRAAREAAAPQTPTEANGDVAAEERAEEMQQSLSQHSLSNERRADERVVDIEDIILDKVPTTEPRGAVAAATSDSKGSTCTALTCVDCAHSSDCDRKRHLEEVIQTTTAPTDADCTFAYFSSLTAGVDRELLRYLSQTRKRLRTESFEVHEDKVGDSTGRDALLDAEEEWILVDKRGKAKARTRAPAEATSCPEHGARDQASYGNSRNSNARGDAENVNASVHFELNKLLTRVVDLSEENRKLKAELESFTKREDNTARNLDETTKPLVSAESAPARPVPTTPAMAVERFYSAEYVVRGAAVLSAVHFWFSVDNLMRDHFLRAQMDVDGYVSLHTLCTFPNLACLGVAPFELAGLLEHSPLVELSASRDACRPRFPPHPHGARSSTT